MEAEEPGERRRSLLLCCLPTERHLMPLCYCLLPNTWATAPTSLPITAGVPSPRRSAQQTLQ